MGWAGSPLLRSCSLADAYVVNEVVDDAFPGRGFPLNLRPRAGKRAPALKLVTMDHVALADGEDGRLGESYRSRPGGYGGGSGGPILLATRGSRFIASKRFLIRQARVLPDFSRYTDTQGQLQLAALLAHVAIRPRYWPGLARIGKNGRKRRGGHGQRLVGPLVDGGSQ
jgi:adenosylhomocysteine nucleosidase